MDSLDDKLREIQDTLVAKVTDDTAYNWMDEILETIADIKHAFQEAGYHKGTVTKYTLPELLSSDSRIRTKPQVTMTGSEWYSRYRTEWNKLIALGDITTNTRIEAAKRASGLREDEA